MTDAIIDLPERARLTDGRVLLRAAVPGDREALHAAVMESKENVGRWMGWCHPEYGMKDVDDWLVRCEACWSSETGDRDFVVIEAASQQLLGCMGLNQFNRVNQFANLGYWVRTGRARQGFTTAGVRLLARYGFESLGLARIEIVAQVGNAASRGVAEKVGCTLEGIARNRLAFRGRHFDAALYSLIPSDIAAL